MCLAFHRREAPWVQPSPIGPRTGAHSSPAHSELEELEEPELSEEDEGDAKVPTTLGLGPPWRQQLRHTAAYDAGGGGAAPKQM